MLPPQPWPDSYSVGIVEHIPPLRRSRHDTGILVQWTRPTPPHPLLSKQAFCGPHFKRTGLPLSGAP